MQIHDGIVVPGELCADLVGLMDLLTAFISGAPPPASVRQARMPPWVRALRITARDAADDYMRRQSRTVAFARDSRPAPAVLASAIARTPSPEEITTEQAATLTGLTEGRIRQLAAAGLIEGRKGPRNTWLLNRSSVRAYQRSPRDRHDSPGHHGAVGAGAA
ncbi:helix-turn-helix domain-containing protein [Streptomyces sp. NPDC008139]|uniref:helix-turn-helix domain-containing protein n=1 Tax=Streptomyces sp. NPDC008139 TaxID=3364814 RepID=UPI0036E6FB64